LPVCVFPIPSVKEKYTHRITVNCFGQYFWGWNVQQYTSKT
jgi:hypothetical protein